MKNANLSSRFGIDKKNAAQSSLVINKALEAEVIKVADPESKSRKYASYLPIWA